MTSGYPTRNMCSLVKSAGLAAFLLLSSCGKNPVDFVVTPGPLVLEIDSYPAWSPNGKTIAFYHYGVVWDTIASKETVYLDSAGIWFISPDGGNKRMFIKGGDLPAWGPRGEWLALVAGTQIFKIKVNGDSLAQLTFEGRNFFPVWSPDGEWIAYDNTNCGSQVEPAPPNSCGILIMKSDGSEKKIIARGRMPDWPLDRKYLIFVGLGSEVYRVNTNDTSEVVQLTSFHKTYAYVYVRTPRYNPDGSKIVFCNTTHDWFGIWVMDSSGGNLECLDKDGMYPSWSPDGKHIVYVGPEKTLWIMDADGINKRQLTFRPRQPE